MKVKLWVLGALLGFLFLLSSGSPSWAFQTTVWLSTNTAVQVSTMNLCNVQTGTSRGVLHGVCINTAATGTVQVFNSSATASNSITGLFSTATQQPCNFYDVATSSGLSFNKNGTADISILYQCY